jgi:predicted chitinase
MEELDRAAMDFIEVESVRRSFRMLHIATRLAQAGVATGLAIELADQALGLAEVATELDGSLREYPNYDREGRLRIFRGRALEAKGWALFKANKNQEAIAALTEAVKAYGSLPEGRRALWRLATVKESEGELEEALDLYIAGYVPPENGSEIDVNRVVIESLHRKINGSLDGLNERLGSAGASTIAQVKTKHTQAEINPTAPKANDVAAKAETNADKSRSKPVSQFKLSIPSEIPAKAQNKSSVATSARQDQPAETIAVVVPNEPVIVPPTNLPSPPSTGPIVLKPAEFSVSSPAVSLITEPTDPPVAPPIAQITSPPVELPTINNAELSVLIRSRIGWLTVISTFNYFTITSTVDEEAPPPPPEPKVHTRKRRVTVPDDQPPGS